MPREPHEDKQDAQVPEQETPETPEEVVGQTRPTLTRLQGAEELSAKVREALNALSPDEAYLLVVTPEQGVQALVNPRLVRRAVEALDTYERVAAALERIASAADLFLELAAADGAHPGRGCVTAQPGGPCLICGRGAERAGAAEEVER